MRILCENVPHSTFTSLIDKMKLIGDIAMIKDQNKIAVALNEFKPHILVLKEDSIDSVIKAYSDKNKVKIISFGSGQDKGDINLRLDVDIPMDIILTLFLSLYALITLSILSADTNYHMFYL